MSIARFCRLRAAGTIRSWSPLQALFSVTVLDRVATQSDIRVELPVCPVIISIEIQRADVSRAASWDRNARAIAGGTRLVPETIDQPDKFEEVADAPEYAHYPQRAMSRHGHDGATQFHRRDFYEDMWRRGTNSGWSQRKISSLRPVRRGTAATHITSRLAIVPLVHRVHDKGRPRGGIRGSRRPN